MTSLFPHPPYAEDQPLSHEILYLHVIRAGAMMGSVFPLITAPSSLLVSRYRHATAFNASTLIPRLLTHSARGLVIGSIFGVVATFARMRGREEIEWKDRSWRLIENKGQVEQDWWTLEGAVVGVITGVLAARRGKMPVGIGKAVLSGAGLGMASGFLGSVVWRQGVKGGKFE
ncbi:uncharacterized protein BDR25DRAFT_108961 [Lindgomyces ingoldianus]|uniref:Uncharacterized protein n=1 Tax=Lindgomyces ingoldianus TaxID=673940 RepID=A0ACB6QAE9_9PLEO|nr:uncharacterized protein BDR25DRAFT_108961 [Lindgomyces ingoldianus]KAF2463495.1 hypothetical protein BDR25DRAFT_108961 [Lindgomyces ingoldianus]